MSRIIEAFTRPHYQVTAIDQIIYIGTWLAILFLALLIWFVIDARRK